MDEKPGLQQFWHRSLLVMGILWGIIPLITLPLLLVAQMIPCWTSGLRFQMALLFSLRLCWRFGIDV
jgi:hypothetical protein